MTAIQNMFFAFRLGVGDRKDSASWLGAAVVHSSTVSERPGVIHLRVDWDSFHLMMEQRKWSLQTAYVRREINFEKTVIHYFLAEY